MISRGLRSPTISGPSLAAQQTGAVGLWIAGYNPMPDEETCEYCLNVVDRAKDKFKVLSHSTPERTAHLECYNKHSEEIRRPHEEKSPLMRRQL